MREHCDDVANEKTFVGGDAPANERRAARCRSESFSETLRVQYGEDGVGRRKSGPIASRVTSGRLA